MSRRLSSLTSRFARTGAPLSSLVLLAGGLTAAGCGNPDGNTIVCGSNTTQVGNECRGPAAPDGGGVDTSTCTGAPVFDGVVSVSPVSPTALQISWAPSTDANADKIKYRVYASTTASGQNFAAPQKETAPGVNHVTVNGLTPANSTWYVVVHAVNECGQEDANATEKSGAAASDTTAPTFGGISEAVASPDAGGAVKVSWVPASDDLTSPAGIVYLVYASTNAANLWTTTPTLTDPGASSFTVAGLPDKAVSYTFGVRARDAAGNIDHNKISKPSNPSPDTKPPSFGGCTDASQKDASSLILKWSAPKDDVASVDQLKINAYIGTDIGKEDFSKPTVTLPASGLSGLLTAIPPLKSKTTYYIICRAVDPAGNEEKNSVEVSAATGEDITPPVFKGLGGVVSVDPTKVTLSWEEGSDDQTPTSAITYTVYYGDASTAPDFYKTPKGTVTGLGKIDVGGLLSNHAYQFAVRAKDAAGNEDGNTVVKSFTTTYGFTSIQAIFDLHCAKSGCHVIGGAAPFPLIAGASYKQIVNVPSSEVPAIVRIAPGDSSKSYLYMKITGAPAITGSVMPPSGAGVDPLSDVEKATIKKWIDDGATDK